jgi:hypothetical protein
MWLSATHSSFPGLPVQFCLSCLSVLLCLSHSSFSILPVLFYQSRFACLILPFLFCQSQSGCPVLSALLYLSHFACPVQPVRLSLSCSVLFCLSCPDCHVLAFLSWLSSPCAYTQVRETKQGARKIRNTAARNCEGESTKFKPKKQSECASAKVFRPGIGSAKAEGRKSSAKERESASAKTKKARA